MGQLLIMLIMLLCISSTRGIENTADSMSILNDCLKQQCTRISVPGKCNNRATMEDPECIFDISKFSQPRATELFNRMTEVQPWVKCDGSDLSEIDLSKGSLGRPLADVNREDSPPTFTIINNLNLKKITLPKLSALNPGFFTIRNNPRLSRLSIDNMRGQWANPLVSIDADKETEASAKAVVKRNTEIQEYGVCDYIVSSSSKKTSLSWPEFRWCRTINHDVILDRIEIKSGSDPAYILNVNGRLTIKNTKIIDLSILPVYFKSKGGEISGNKDLCINFEDEIRMKRLGFKMENNKPLSCRTTCDSGALNLQTINNVKDCVTLNGGLKLDEIDANTAAADFFKTIRIINGPVVITNAKVTVDFKELKEIRLAGESSPHISLMNCTHPILFPNLTTLSGTQASPMVVLYNTRIDIFNYLNRTYTGKIKDLSRESMLETTTASGDIVASVSPSSNNKLTPGAVTHGNRPVGQSSETPVEQQDDREPVTIKAHGTPEKKPEEPNTAVSPVGDSDDAAVKNSNLPSQEDPNSSAVEGKSNLLMVMTIVSLVVFLASSATSVGIIIKYSVI